MEIWVIEGQRVSDTSDFNGVNNVFCLFLVSYPAFISHGPHDTILDLEIRIRRAQSLSHYLLDPEPT
ncbi:hypothetical protein PNOK_0830100 [Pyrrhoderma noxium]|uniref:Uncharacterized protein n=1 Tax=Pyrrhoderma noxium TaxID=2282107 RepID=A0A286UAS3_9AGAM|nr:hypothetical protein PNOK_0830100 [Pyrrhoderma noxium]